MALAKVNYESQTDSYWVQLSQSEMKLIAALMWSMRLGQGNIFKEAAFNISSGIEAALSDDYLAQAADAVGLYFSLEDAEGHVGALITSPYAAIEVTGGDITEDTPPQIAANPIP